MATHTAARPGTTPIPFEGKLKGGGVVKFDLQQPVGDGYQVVNFKWKNLRIKCRSGKHKHDGRFKNAIPVDENRHFRYKALRQGGGGFAKVIGTFNRTYESASGILKVRGRTGWGSHCRSGRVDWHAESVAARV